MTQPGQPPAETHPAATQPEPAADPADQRPTSEAQATAADRLDQMSEATGGTVAPDSGPPPDSGEPITGEVRVEGNLAVNDIAEITAEYSDKDAAVGLTVDAPEGPTCDKCGAPGAAPDSTTWHHTGRGSPWTVRVALTRPGAHKVRFHEGGRTVAETEFDVAEAAEPATEAEPSAQ